MLAVTSFSAVGAVLSFVSISTICFNGYVSCCSVGIYLHLKMEKQMFFSYCIQQHLLHLHAFVGVCLFNSGYFR